MLVIGFATIINLHRSRAVLSISTYHGACWSLCSSLSLEAGFPTSLSLGAGFPTSLSLGAGFPTSPLLPYKPVDRLADHSEGIAGTSDGKTGTFGDKAGTFGDIAKTIAKRFNKLATR